MAKPKRPKLSEFMLTFGPTKLWHRRCRKSVEVETDDWNVTVPVGELRVRHVCGPPESPWDAAA